jgi:hypothetical protein
MHAFVGPTPEGREIAHLNGDRSDNRLANLKYVDHTENQAHMVKHGRSLQGEKHHKAKLTPCAVVEVRRSKALGRSYGQLAAEHGVSKATVKDIVARRTWKHLA